MGGGQIRRQHPACQDGARLADDLPRRRARQVLPTRSAAAGPERPRQGIAPHARLDHAARAGLRNRWILQGLRLPLRQCRDRRNVV
ncbi:MAG TPA: hypothetical protein DIU00_01265, partial [Phycisphaerales bacterium]|nr:hypothetical protein [Phycisphaerales bacterium]